MTGSNDDQRIERVDPDGGNEGVELTPEEEREVTSEPVEVEGGTTRIQQQNMGSQGSIGSGEFPDPDAPPVEPAPGADGSPSDD
ncbi:MAG: hypothetical protein ACXIVQ_11125 [Acidimicrobiales bacterium]